MRKVILLLSVLAVIAVGWFLYFNEGDSIAFVSLYEVKAADLSNTLEFSGEVSPTKIYSVMSETGGTIESMAVSEGSRVSKGDTLFQLDDSKVQAQLKQAQLQYEALLDSQAQMTMAQPGSDTIMEQKAKVALALSQTTGYDYESLNEAFGSKAAQAVSQTGSSLSQSLNSLSAANSLAGAVTDLGSQIELAELSVQQLKNAIQRMTYKSLISGTVVSMNIHLGEVLSPGIPAMVIADTDNTIITGYVYEKDLADLKVGIDATILTDEGKFKGKLTSIGSAATDVGNATAFDTMAKVQITPDGKFKKMIGAVVDLKIVLSRKEDVLSIPLDCLTDDNCVFVLGENDVAEKRAIITGFEDSQNIEVIGGLNAGDKVIASPNDIKEGQKVNYDRG